MKRGARPSSSDTRRERSSHAPSSGPKLPPLQRSAPPSLNKPREPYRDEQARSVVPKGSEGLSLSEEARAYGRDEREAQLLEQFFSWPPPPPRAADLTVEPFERAPLPRGTRRAIWASSLILVLSGSAIGSYFAYHNYVMPPPAALGDWSDTDTLPLPTPILADDVAQPDTEPRRVYQASLQHDMSAITQAEPVAVDEAPAGPQGAAQTAPSGEEAQGAYAAAEPETPGAQAPGDAHPAIAATAPSTPSAQGQADAHAARAAAAQPSTPQLQGDARAAGAVGAQPSAAQAPAEARAPVAVVAAAQPSAAQAQGDARVGGAIGSQPSAAQAPVEARAPGQTRAAVAETQPSAVHVSGEARAGGTVGAQPSGEARAEGTVGAQPSASATGAQAPVANAVAEPSVQAVPVKPLPAADAAVSFYEHLSLAQQQLAQGQLRESLPTFDRALALRAHSVDALLGKATAQFGLKEYEAAKSSAQLAVAIDPRSNEAFALIAGSLERLGQRAQAKAIYERCVDEAVDATICRERLGRMTAGE